MPHLQDRTMTRLFIFSFNAFSHSDGENYVFVKFMDMGIEGEFHINSKDLESLLQKKSGDGNQGRFTLSKDNIERIKRYISANFQIAPSGGNRYNIHFLQAKMLGAEGSFLVIPFRAPADSKIPRVLDIRNTMFHSLNPTHRGLLLVQYDELTDTDFGPERTSLVFGPHNSQQTLDLDNVPGLISKSGMIYQGMLHIWAGIDHILFLLALILPIVLVRKNQKFVPAESFYSAFKTLLAIVTVFTVAHSVTLLLAALELIKVDSKLVESVIALSIILAALNNIYRLVTRGALWIILFLGLFHGLGFASVMANLPFRMQDLLGMVIGFNIGVELGQIVIVTLIFPLLYLMRDKAFYQPVLLKGGSWALVAIATYWMVQRIIGT